MSSKVEPSLLYSNEACRGLLLDTLVRLRMRLRETGISSILLNIMRKCDPYADWFLVSTADAARQLAIADDP